MIELVSDFKCIKKIFMLSFLTIDKVLTKNENYFVVSFRSLKYYELRYKCIRKINKVYGNGFFLNFGMVLIFADLHLLDFWHTKHNFFLFFTFISWIAFFDCLPTVGYFCFVLSMWFAAEPNWNGKKIYIGNVKLNQYHRKVLCAGRKDFVIFKFIGDAI